MRWKQRKEGNGDGEKGRRNLDKSSEGAGPFSLLVMTQEKHKIIKKQMVYGIILFNICP